MIKKIGIIGLGMVGGAIEKYYSGSDFEIIKKDLEFDEGINNADVIFISVPTPYSDELKGYNLDAIRENLKLIEDGKVVVIKSTVTPGTTDMFQKEFPNLNILFNPEFLTEATTDVDFNNPDRQIIGYTENSKEFAQEVLDILPKAEFNKIMPAKEAELIKLAGNAFMSMKVVYYNQLYDICESNGIDYDIVKEGVGADRRIGKSHSDVWYGGRRGFGGKCLPKDINALISYTKENEGELFKIIKEINDKLCK